MDDHFSACFRYFYGVLFNLKANTKGLIKNVAAFDVAFGETIQAKSSWFRTGDCHHWTQNGDSGDGKQRKCSGWHGHRSVSCEACSDCLNLFEPYNILASCLADHIYLLYVLWLPYASTCFLATPKITTQWFKRSNGTLWYKCPVLATRSLLSFFILSSTLLRGVEVWKSLTKWG